MPDMFQLDDRELKLLLKFFKRAPKDFQRASAAMLNGFAFGVREQAIKKINDNMIVRSPGFVKSSIKYQKTSARPIQYQEAITGSIYRDRFTGWIEQETGRPSNRTRTQNLDARGGSKQNKMKSGLRMKPNNIFHEYKNFGSKYAKTRGQKFVAMMESIRSGKVSKKPFIVRQTLPGNLNKFKPGLYTFVERGSITYSNKSKLKSKRGAVRTRKGRFSRVQSFKKKDVPTKRLEWMKEAREEYFKKIDMKVQWHNVLIKQGIVKLK